MERPVSATRQERASEGRRPLDELRRLASPVEDGVRRGRLRLDLQRWAPPGSEGPVAPEVPVVRLPPPEGHCGPVAPLRRRESR